MKSNYNSPLPFGGLISITPDEIESSLPLADAGWLFIRKQQMDINANSIFPRREGSSILRRVKPVKMILIALLKIIVR